MRLQLGVLSIVAFTTLLFLLTINPWYEDSRVVHEDEQVWMRKNHLLLPSQWRHVTPPSPNPATNVADLSKKNFATTKQGGLLSNKIWRPVFPPSPNSAINSNPTICQKKFAGLQSKKEHLFLPSLQTKQPVSPPGPNPGQNSIGPVEETMSSKWRPIPSPSHNSGIKFNPVLDERNFASLQLRKEHFLSPSLQTQPVNPLAFNLRRNPVNPIEEMMSPKRKPISYPSPNFGINSNSNLEENFANFHSTKEHLLLPSLQTQSVTPPGPNKGHNSVGPISEKNFASLKMRKNHISLPSLKMQPSSPPGTNLGQNSVSNVGTKKNFAGRKMTTAHPALLPSLIPSQMTTS